MDIDNQNLHAKIENICSCKIYIIGIGLICCFIWGSILGITIYIMKFYMTQPPIINKCERSLKSNISSDASYVNKND